MSFRVLRDGETKIEGKDVAASAGNTIDPIHQFQVNKIVPINLFGQDVSFSNASLFMAIVVLSILGLMVYGTRKQALIPGRLQAAAEMSYEFVAATKLGRETPETRDRSLDGRGVVQQLAGEPW